MCHNTVIHTILTQHYAPPFCQLDLATSMRGGGGRGLIVEISLIYTPPFLASEHARETAMAELAVTILHGVR